MGPPTNTDVTNKGYLFSKKITVSNYGLLVFENKFLRLNLVYLII